MMRKILVISLLTLVSSSFAQEINGNSNKSDIDVGLGLQSKYVWRGMEMLTMDSSPIIFPSINYSNGGVYAYVMGGYATNGIYGEVDLGISYNYKCLTVALNDYYYPTTNSAADHYFDFSKNTTGHWLEGVITIAPEEIPAYLLFSNFFYGADKTIDGKQAYSTYVELGAHYAFFNENRLSLALGAALNESCYNGYEQAFCICNIELKYTHTLQFVNGWTLPLNVAYIINPMREKAFVNFSTSFVF